MTHIGKLLIAPPSVKDSFWAKSVVLVTEDTRVGSSGIILNKTSKVSLTEFAKKFQVNINSKDDVYVGGPVDIMAMIMLHTSDWCCKNTLRITDELSISSTRDLLHRVSVGDCPKRYKFFLGRCIWEFGQLENEIQGNYPYHHDYSWLVSQPRPDLIFTRNDTNIWSESVRHCGTEFVQNLLS